MTVFYMKCNIGLKQVNQLFFRNLENISATGVGHLQGLSSLQIGANSFDTSLNV